MEPEPTNPAFPPTQWTAVLRVRRSDDTAAAAKALEALCRQYWYPLYAFARRFGHAREDAEDLTQGFLSYLVQKDILSAAVPELGKLRTFLLTVFQRYLSGARDRDRAAKRGGGQEVLSLDVGIGEERYADEPLDSATPENLFDRNWAIVVMRGAFRRLAKSEADAGRGKQFTAFEPFLSPDEESEATYEMITKRLAISEEAARQALSRLRKKFREALRQQIADTLYDPTRDQVDSEMQSLREALGS